MLRHDEIKDEKKMMEIANENIRMNEPLEQARQVMHCPAAGLTDSPSTDFQWSERKLFLSPHSSEWT
jgi:hypothetical protein